MTTGFMPLLKALNAASFLSLVRFGEEIGVNEPGEDQRRIHALVDRFPVQGIQEAPGGQRPMIHVYVANDATDGISSATLDTGTWTVSLARRIGASEETFTIGRVLAQDEAMVQLECR